MGEEVRLFEQEFARFHGMKHAIMVNSGSSANLIMVAALAELGKIKRGDKVIVPALAWSTTYAPLVQHGLELILADCDDTWNAKPMMDLSLSNLKLAIGCSILGNPANISEFDSRVPIIEDNCESLGAFDVQGTLCGTRGLMNSFSFYWSHQISAIEGGMILTNYDEYNVACRMLRAHGWSRDVLPPSQFEDEYQFVMHGYNVRPLELHAAIAREQLRKLPEFILQRQYNFARFMALAYSNELPIQSPKMQGLSSPFGLHFELNDFTKRQELVNKLRAKGIDCRLPTGGSFRKHPYGKPWSNQLTPRADQIHDRGMFLGNAPFDISEQIDAAVEVMKEVL